MKPVAYEGKEKYIFISYAHKDSELVMRIMNSLQAEGYRIWYDDGIIPGSEWPENIAMHLNDAAMVIAMISPNSMASHNCRREINFALSKQKPFLSVILEPTEMSLGMEMQLSAQNIVMRQNYGRWEEFIAKIMLCPGLEPCKISDGELPERNLPRGMQMESESNRFVYGAPVVEEPKKKKRNPLVFICGIFAVCVVVLSAMLFGGKDMPDMAVSPTVIPMDHTIDYTPTGELLLDGKWLTGTVQVYAVDDRNYEVLLTDFFLPNGYTSSEIPGKREAYWNVCLCGGASEMFSVNITEPMQGMLDYECLYYYQNAIFDYTGYVDLERQKNTFILKVEMPQEVNWNTKDLNNIYVNLGTEDEGRSDHYDFWPN